MAANLVENGSHFRNGLGTGDGMVFGWFRSERCEKRRKVRRDREHLESKARRFLKSYLEANETRKPQFYRAVEEASRQCQPDDLVRVLSELEDSLIAEATSNAAMDIVLNREKTGNQGDRVADFVTDAYATVGIAYHRAAGVYAINKDMEKLGTAAVHLLTMATSYLLTQKE